MSTRKTYFFVKYSLVRHGVFCYNSQGGGRVDKPYFIYLLRCADNSIYTGITTDIRRRFAEHSGAPVGAKYTASHTPLCMECAWECRGRSAASRLEYRIKKTLTHAQKEELIKTPSQLESLLGHLLDCTVYTVVNM